MNSLMDMPPDIRRKSFTDLDIMTQYIRYTAESKEFKQWADKPNGQGVTLWTYLLLRIWTKAVDLSKFPNTRWLYFSFAAAVERKSKYQFGATYFVNTTESETIQIACIRNTRLQYEGWWMSIFDTDQSTGRLLTNAFRACGQQWMGETDYSDVSLSPSGSFGSSLTVKSVAGKDSKYDTDYDIPIIASAMYALFEVGYRLQMIAPTGQSVSIRGCGNTEATVTCETAVYCNQLQRLEQSQNKEWL